MSQENLQTRFSQCKDDGIPSGETSSQGQEAPSQPLEQSFVVLRHEHSTDSQKEFERTEFDRIIQPPTSSQTTNANGNSQKPTNSQQVAPPSDSQKSEKCVNENAPAVQSEITHIEPVEITNSASQSEAVVNGPSGPDTVTSQSSNEE